MFSRVIHLVRASLLDHLLVLIGAAPCSAKDITQDISISQNMSYDEMELLLYMKKLGKRDVN